MKYFRGAQQQCLDLASDMDTFFKYPNSTTKTTTTSEVLTIPNTSEYCIYVPDDYLSQMTSEEIESLLEARPSELEYKE
tara:strand:- start:1284 stop:1520 length:237 start_codon:yes stop_codon:yes gene_type:complete